MVIDVHSLMETLRWDKHHLKLHKWWCNHLLRWDSASHILLWWVEVMACHHKIWCTRCILKCKCMIQTWCSQCQVQWLHSNNHPIKWTQVWCKLTLHLWIKVHFTNNTHKLNHQLESQSSNRCRPRTDHSNFVKSLLMCP